MYLVHDDAMDVFVEVIKTQYRGRNYRKVKVRWWNLGFTGQPWPLITETIKIKNSDWNKWKMFNPHTDTHPGRRK